MAAIRPTVLRFGTSTNLGWLSVLQFSRGRSAAFEAGEQADARAEEPVGRRCVATQGVGLRTRTDKGPRIRWRASRGLAPRERASVMRAATRGAGHQGPDARRQDRSFGWDAQGARVAAVRIATHFSSSSPFFFSFPCKFVRDSPILA
jgi:hypothetical protein